MRAEIIIQDGKNALVSGMKWQALRNYKGDGKVNKDIRDKAELSSAEKVVIHSVRTEQGVMSSLGLYVGNEFSALKAKNLFSLAIAFVQKFPENKNMVLVFEGPASSIAVIVVHNGIPVADEVKSLADAKRLVKDVLAGAMGESNYALYANSLEVVEAAQLITSADFLAGCNKASKVTGLPPKTTIIAASLLVAVVSFGIIYSAYADHKKKEKEKIVASEAASDPIAPYQLKLGSALSKIGLDRGSIIETISLLSNGNVWSDGWILQKIDCVPMKCISSWERKGGITSDLLARHPGELLLVDSTLDLVRLVKNVPLKEGGLADLSAAQEMADVYTKYVDTYQQWGNAGINVTQSSKLEDFKTWPTPTAGDISRLPKTITLKARPVEVVVPLHLSTELILSTPPGVWWSSFTIKYSPSDIEKRLTVQFKGNTYVR